VMRICQEDEAADALKKVLQTVRDRTRAAVVDVATARRAGLALMPSGARATCASRRSADSGIAVDPQAAESGYEAAVPLRFSGRLVGAIGCRWTAAPPLEAGRLMGFLGAVAAAVAPCVASLDEPLEPVQVATVGAELLGESAGLQAIRQAVVRAADAPFPVLIQGESGSGKELVARAIHRASSRRHRLLCAVNCAALPDELLEAELFGHARGAFTGAVAERAGLFEEADGGVLFLDEIGELSPRAQAKLLRALQDGEVKRVGETFARRVDARIVAATNRALEQEVTAGRFRRDLRYRLDVIRIVVPPLRERPEDIPLLVEHFWRHAAERVGSRARLGSAVIGTLVRYDWPGNVRELQNVLASLAVSASRRGVVGVSALPAVLASQATRGIDTTLDAARRMFEERFVRAALARSGGHRGRAAAELGLTRQGLSKLMGRLGMANGADAMPGDRPQA
jgi:transcriptional regulator with PAS, ATPase and Fis domain